IGRGERQSYCILLRGQNIGREARFRLKKMAQTNDGFEIAEADLQLRGPGDFLGTKQSGLPDFKVADIVEDQSLVEQTKEDARLIMNEDPDLDLPKHKNLHNIFRHYFKKRKKFYGLG
ncbi:MAG TPA: ATP-dependent DNA helicase RecG, partial [Balneolaceae bacterium]|nr:ATP-dependent DNA helicase RecG [Balneolaceae bacterium]